MHVILPAPGLAVMMVVNIKVYYTLTALGFAVASMGSIPAAIARATVSPAVVEPVHACVVAQEWNLTPALRAQIAHCLGWQTDMSICHGTYKYPTITPLPDEHEIRVKADEVSLYAEGRSHLKGHVEVQETQRIVQAQTAYIYRDSKTKQVTHIELLGDVHYLEPDRLMIARSAVINPQDKSGEIKDVLYRFKTTHAFAALPAWGRASFIQRFSNKDYALHKATYTTCAPQDKSWQIEAREINIYHAEERGVAKDAILRINDWPLLYTPYLSFPTSKKRKSGFLMPLYGYSNVGGLDLALPYYLNLAPNYDATVIPHLYTRRGLMIGGDLRFLTPHSQGIMSGHILPHDQAFSNFLNANRNQYPILQGLSDDRWSFLLHENTWFNPNLRLNINFQQVSDDYYLQDFSTNLAIMTQNQLLRKGDLTYTTDHWLFKGMLQSYQTLHPINQSNISNIYERLPQLLANGVYTDLPLNADLNILGQFDYFRWPGDSYQQPQGPRYHVNPTLAFPQLRPWGYVTPTLQLVENYYEVHYSGALASASFDRTIPRYSLDSSLFFERPVSWMGHSFTQTLEPRFYYLYVPYHDQTPIPVYDSAYMIFNTGQLFRDNRFSGFDRIGDTNQLSYAITSRWLSEETGQEKASFTIGQIRYFADRRVQLCYNRDNNCSDTPLMLGYLSPKAKWSPIASRAVYQLSPGWTVSGDYIWDVYTRSTNNGYINLHYQPMINHVVSFGYNFFVNGDVTQVANGGIENNNLSQGTLAYAWPFNDRWSSLGIYSYNLSKKYSMLEFLGVQYEDCCWAFRVLGGRAFKSLSPTTLAPQYNNNIYFQVLLKGLGSAASGDPTSVIRSYLPGYVDMF